MICITDHIPFNKVHDTIPTTITSDPPTSEIWFAYGIITFMDTGGTFKTITCKPIVHRKIFIMIPFKTHVCKHSCTSVNDINIIPKYEDLLALKSKNLNKREKECAYYLVLGMTAKEMANVLYISPKTVEYHLDNMKRKFGCCRKSDLIMTLLNETNLE